MAGTGVHCVDAYGMSRPGLAEARGSLERVFGALAGPVWSGVLADAGLDPRRVSDADVEQVVAAFGRNADPVVVLCGHALEIRVRSFEHLHRAQELSRGAGTAGS